MKNVNLRKLNAEPYVVGSTRKNFRFIYINLVGNFTSKCGACTTLIIPNIGNPYDLVKGDAVIGYHVQFGSSLCYVQKQDGRLFKNGEGQVK